MAYDNNGAWKPEDDSVATRVGQLTGADSPLMQRAQGNAMKAANRRGLINSTMAARAGAAAAIDAATPIASQDAAQTAQKNLQAQSDWAARDRQVLSGTQTSDLARQNADAERDLQQLRGTQAIDLQTLTGHQQSDLSSQDYRQQSGLTAQQAAAQRDLQLLSGSQSMDLARQNATSQRDLQLLSGSQASDLARQNADAERSLQQLRGEQDAATNTSALTAQARNQFSVSATGIYNSFNEGVATIMANTNLSAEARSSALASLQASTNAGLGLISRATGVPLDWGTGSTASGAAASLPTGIGSAQSSAIPTTDTPAAIAYRRVGDQR